MNHHGRWLALMTSLISLNCLAAEGDRIVQDSLSRSYVTAALLTEGDAVRFGFWNFNPNDYLDFEDDNFGTAEASALRQRISTVSMPYEWTWRTADGREEVGFLAKAAYVAVEQEGQLVVSEDTRKDTFNNSVLSAALGMRWRHALTQNWNLTLRSNLHWMRYRNDTSYNNPDSMAVAPALDGVLTNIKVDALMAEPSLMLGYDLINGAARWHFFSDYHYLAGDTYHTDISAHDANPEAWFWSNGVKMTNPLISKLLPGQNVWFRAARVDLGGDLDEPLGNHYYYEAGLAWLLNTGDYVPLLDNIGIGINFNYGSVLRGGSLVLLFNET